MQLARVIGSVVASHKEPGLTGVTLLVVQPIDADGSDRGRALVAVDAVSAGVGERVFFVRGKEASFPFLPTEVVADAAIVGIVDHWSVQTDDHPNAHSPRVGGPGGDGTRPGPGRADGARLGGSEQPR